MSKFDYLPAGTYFIGDPCYVFSHDTNTWNKLLDATNYLEPGGIFDFNGTKLFAAGTAYGDGGYLGSDGVIYSVDAGLLGAVPESLWERPRESFANLGKIVTEKHPMPVSGIGGYFVIGNVDINTDDSEESDYDNE